MKKINIAICGLGNIGSYLYKYLIKNKKQLTEKNRSIPNILLVYAKNKKEKKFYNSKKKWAKNFDEIIKNKIDLIVELIGGSEGQKNLVFKALNHKKHVVTVTRLL